MGFWDKRWPHKFILNRTSLLSTPWQFRNCIFHSGKWKWWWKKDAFWNNWALPVGPFCQWPTYGVPWIFAYCSRNHYSKSCKIAQTFRVIIVLVRSWKFQELHVVSLMPPHRGSLPPKTTKQLKLKKKLKWYSLMNTYETAPNFIQLSQNLGTSKLDIGLFVNFCFLAVFTNFYRMCS